MLLPGVQEPLNAFIKFHFFCPPSNKHAHISYFFRINFIIYFLKSENFRVQKFPRPKNFADFAVKIGGFRGFYFRGWGCFGKFRGIKFSRSTRKMLVNIFFLDTIMTHLTYFQDFQIIFRLLSVHPFTSVTVYCNYFMM